MSVSHFASFRTKNVSETGAPLLWLLTEEENSSWYVGEDGGVEAGREVRVLRVPGQARVPQHAPAQVGSQKEIILLKKQCCGLGFYGDHAFLSGFY